VAAGATARLRSRARERFLAEEWPRIRATIRRLKIDPAELLEERVEA
jgi:GntR family transcriptional regulator